MHVLCMDLCTCCAWICARVVHGFVVEEYCDLAGISRVPRYCSVLVLVLLSLLR